MKVIHITRILVLLMVWVVGFCRLCARANYPTGKTALLSQIVPQRDEASIFRTWLIHRRIGRAYSGSSGAHRAMAPW